MKKLLLVFFLMFSSPLFASGINANSASAPCDNDTLNKYTGTANVEINWEPNTISLNWYDGDEKLTVNSNAQSCTYDGTLTVPPAPTKLGYTFNGWKVIPVPGGCKRIEYLENNGSEEQYIDTGVPGDNNNYRIVIDFTILNIPQNIQWHALVKNRIDDSHNMWRILLSKSGQMYFGTNTNGQASSSIIGPTIQVNQRYSVDFNYDRAIVNGTTYNAGQHLIGNNNNNTIKIFSRSLDMTSRVYSFMIYENGNLIRNMIPILDKNNVPCMWDKITGQFFYNVGTENFVAGPEVQ